jgi:hypothetical protein
MSHIAAMRGVGLAVLVGATTAFAPLKRGRAPRYVRPRVVMSSSEAAPVEKIPLVITTIDARQLDTGRWQFDKNIPGNPNDDKALFLKDVTVRNVTETGFWGRLWRKKYKVYEGTEVSNVAAEIDRVATAHHAEHCLLYVHGFTNTPSEVVDAVQTINRHYHIGEPGRHPSGKKALGIPVIWPAERISLKEIFNDFGYADQKEDAPGAARALRSLVPSVKGAKTPLSVMCHSMGNYVLKKFAPDEKTGDEFFKNIFMVAADVRATIFDENATDSKDNDGPDILGMCKNKVHVLWNKGDLALLGRRLTGINQDKDDFIVGRAALGKIGKQNSEGKLISNGAKLSYKDCNGFAQEKDWPMGHGYHLTNQSMDYYLEHL